MITSGKIKRESDTLQLMIGLYCRDNHQTANGLCEDCEELLTYSRKKLERCPFQENKTTCAKCPVHCYQLEQKTQIRKVMRYAGPRMLLAHPKYAILHLLDGLIPPPRGKNKRN